jgi:YD repeat-containing protein
MMEAAAPPLAISSRIERTHTGRSGSMSDLAKWKLRGPVRTVRSEWAEWDAAREAWTAPRRFTVTEFRADGKIGSNETHNADGSIARTAYRYDERGRLLEVQRGDASNLIYSYDESGRHVRTMSVDADGGSRESESCRYDSTGRKTKVSVLHTPALNVEVMQGVEGTDTSFSAPGATTSTTIYDERELPQEVLLHDANHAMVRRVTFTRDREGRVLSEAVEFGGQFPFANMQKELGERSSPEEAASLAALLTHAFGGRMMHSTTYAYDRHGRVLERSTRMGTLGETRSTYRYDDRDNPIEEIVENQSREIGANADGTVRTSNESVRAHIVRMEYQYDREGNWTERIVSSRMDPNPNFERSNVERRQITYYAG